MFLPFNFYLKFKFITACAARHSLSARLQKGSKEKLEGNSDFPSRQRHFYVYQLRFADTSIVKTKSVLIFHIYPFALTPNGQGCHLGTAIDGRLGVFLFYRDFLSKKVNILLFTIYGNYGIIQLSHKFNIVANFKDCILPR